MDNDIMEVKAVGVTHGNRHALLERLAQYNSNDTTVTFHKIPQMETIVSTAKILDLPVHFVRVAVANGDVVSVRAGCKFLVNIDSVIAFLNTGKPQGAVANTTESVRRFDKGNTSRVAPISLR